VPKRGGQGPSVGEYLLVAALNRCIAPCSKAQIGEWYAKTALRRLLPLAAGQLTSQWFWDNMARVTPAHIAAIEQDLARTAVARFGLDLRWLLFDATNFFTFVDSFNARATLPQRGHSKEGRANLRLLGLALLVTSDGEVPLFHHTYAGNQHDAVTFKSVAEELFDRCRALTQGACDITLVFDKGNNSGDTLAIVGASPVHFVGSLVPTQHHDLLSIARKAMRVNLSDLAAFLAVAGNKFDYCIDFTRNDRSAFLAFLSGAPKRIVSYRVRDQSKSRARLYTDFVNVRMRDLHTIDYNLSLLKPLSIGDVPVAVEI
jgi:transposase